MASIRKRNKKHIVVYWHLDENGIRKQKWQSYETKKEAKDRKISLNTISKFMDYALFLWNMNWRMR